MNTKATFENTVGILVKAYLEGTLLKGSCLACAVGNICAAALGHTVSGSYVGNAEWVGAEYGAMWQHLFMSPVSEFQRRYFEEPEFDAKRVSVRMGQEQVDATGYTNAQLARVESAFEGASDSFNGEAAFAGLMAVVDVLADIHGIDLTTATAAKALFVKA